MATTRAAIVRVLDRVAKGVAIVTAVIVVWCWLIPVLLFVLMAFGPGWWPF